MEEQDITMGSASSLPSPTTNNQSDQELDAVRSPFPPQEGAQPPPSPGPDSATSGAVSSDDDDDEEDDEGAEEHERVDENGAIVIEDDDDSGDDEQEERELPPIVKVEPPPESSSSIAIPALLNEAVDDRKLSSNSKSPEAPSLPLSAPTATNKPKPKSKVKARSPSPIPIAPPPLQTVRLSIKLGGPDNYTVDIGELAKATGQRPPSPVHKKPDEYSDSDANQSAADTKKKKKKKNGASEYYDVNDPFIDDSELAVDDRKFFAQTKQSGFYVSSGEVALMKDRTPKKPKSKRFNAEAGPSSQNPRQSSEGTKDAPIALDEDSDATRPAVAKGNKKKSMLSAGAPSNATSAQYGTGLSAPLTGNLAAMRKLNWGDPDPADMDDNEGYGDGGEKTGMKRKRVTYSTVVENGKKRKVIDIEASFHPQLQASLQKLREAIAVENWEQKGKFPPSIKPLLAQIAIEAIKLDQYDDHFFNLMPTLFPYNKFTMSKLIKRTVFNEHTKLLVERQEALLAELKRQADEGFPKAEDEWEKSVVAWDTRQKRLKADQRAEDSGSNGAPTRHPTEDPDGMDEDHPPSTMPPQTQSGKPHSEKEAQPPPKKFRMTENMKAIVWELVLLSNECCRLENEKNTLEGSVMQVSDQGLRKVLYQKIVGAFPSGWMNSGQISRDVSAMKKKLEREIAEEQELETQSAVV